MSVRMPVATLLWVALLVAGVQRISAQDASLLDPAERMALDAEDGAIDEETLVLIQSLRESPLDLNRATRDQLSSLPGIDARLADQFIKIRRAHGPFRAWSDLHHAFVEGAHVLEELRPLVSLEARRVHDARTGRRRSNAGRGVRASSTSQYYQRSDVRMRQAGPSQSADFIQRTSLRLAVQAPSGWGGRVKLVPGSVDVAEHIGGGQLRMMEGRVHVVGGAYSASFGAGLLLPPSGMRDPWRALRRGAVVQGASLRPRSSASSGAALSGIGAHLTGVGPVRAAFVYSNKTPAASGRRILGAMLEAQLGTASVGLAGMQTTFPSADPSEPRLHERHRFYGPQMRATSIYVDVPGRRSRLAFEAAVAGRERAALIAALQIRTADQTDVAVVLRAMGRRYPLTLGRPSLVTAAEGTGERGALVGINTRRGSWRARLVVDAAHRLWASTSASWPSPVVDARLQIERRTAVADFFLQIRHQQTPVNSNPRPSSQPEVLRPLAEHRESARVQGDFQVGARVQIRLRIDAVRTREEQTASRGIAAYQQLRLRPLKSLLVELRTTSFSTGTSASRIYMHETDVLYQPVLNILSGDGVRHFARVRWDLGAHVVIEAKVGRMTRDRVETTGDYPPLRERRTDMRVQVRLSR